MRRLHIQFYLAILAALGVFVAAIAIYWSISGNWHGEAMGMTATAQLAQVVLPPPTASRSDQQRSIDDLQRRLRIDLAVYDHAGQLIASTAGLPYLPPDKLAEDGWTRVRRSRPVWVLPLEDGRRLVVRPGRSPQRMGAHVILVPIAIVLAFALGAYPIARRLTSRLARLQTGVEQLGQGALATRVAVEGRDEVAALARSFNQSATRIEELVKSYKLLLANCSHELRTPLARIRLALERLARGPDASMQEELRRSVAELDELIEEMLLASRLDALKALERHEDVDLLALAAEEAAHFDRSVEGRAAFVRGDPTLLRRLVRNLLENAQHHAAGATLIHVGTNEGGGAQLIVEDAGPGVAAEDREKIFEPFYRAGRAQASTSGSGLGLSIVRQIARAHGGEVSHAPLARGGSKFMVTLPRSH